MNPNYSEFKFPVIKANDLKKIFSCRKQGKEFAVDLVTKILKYNPQQRPKPLKALQHQFFDDLRLQETKLPNGQPLPDLFDFSEEEKGSTSADVIKSLIPSWYIAKK
jgi:glycogen synthase kinase 3 beta